MENALSEARGAKRRFANPRRVEGPQSRAAPLLRTRFNSTALRRWHRRRIPYVYLLRCSDDAFYVGMTNDPVARFSRHLDGLASRFTAARLPVEMVYVEEAPSLQAAVARERQIKRWSRAKKQALVDADLNSLHTRSKRHRY